MSHRWGTLGLLLALALAIGAVGPAGASAFDQFHFETGFTTELKGEQVNTNQFEFLGYEPVKCSTTKLTGSNFGSTVNQVTVHPEYSGCTAFGFASTDVKTTGCNYILEGASSPVIECESGKKIEITPTVFGSSVCTLTIGAQTLLGTVDYENQGKESSRDIRLNFTDTTFLYSEGACGVKSPLGHYTGQITLKALKGSQVGFWFA
jgi:hypothetical protein